MKSYICSSSPNKIAFSKSHDMNVNAHQERWSAFYKAGCGHLSLHMNVFSGVHIFHVTFTASLSSYHGHFVKWELQRMNVRGHRANASISAGAWMKLSICLVMCLLYYSFSEVAVIMLVSILSCNLKTKCLNSLKTAFYPTLLRKTPDLCCYACTEHWLA